MGIAFFDFDGTITKHDSFIEFAKFSLSRKCLYSAIVKNSLHLTLWKLGVLTNSEAKQKLFSALFKGKEYAWFKSRGVEFKEIIKNDLNQNILYEIRQHQEAGHKVVIVTASIPEWIYPWATEIGIDTVLGTEIEVNKKGFITGKFRTPNCHSIEKVNRIKALYPDIADIETWGYGDSDGDTPMLNLVRHATKVK